MTNNVYKGVQAWMQALLEASQSNTLGNWWNARTLECVMLGTELSVAGKLEVYKDGLDFTKALFQAARDGLLTQSDVDYNTNQLLLIRWRFATDFFLLEENVQDELTSSDEEAIITFTASVEDSSKEDTVKQEAVVLKPKALGGRPKKVNK